REARDGPSRQHRGGFRQLSPFGRLRRAGVRAPGRIARETYGGNPSDCQKCRTVTDMAEAGQGLGARPIFARPDRRDLAGRAQTDQRNHAVDLGSSVDHGPRPWENRDMTLNTACRDFRSGQMSRRDLLRVGGLGLLGLTLPDLLRLEAVAAPEK